jgi:hypothetical protein
MIPAYNMIGYPITTKYSKSSDDSSIQYTRLSHYNVATVKVVMIPAYNILGYLITTLYAGIITTFTVATL